MSRAEFTEGNVPHDANSGSFSGSRDGAQPPITEVVSSRAIPQAPVPLAIERVSAHLGPDTPETAALHRAAAGKIPEVTVPPVPTALERIAERLGAYSPEVQALQRAVDAENTETSPSTALPPTAAKPAIENVVTRLGGDEIDAVQALRRATTDSARTVAETPEEVSPLPEHGVDRVAPLVITHNRVHLSTNYHSDASFEKMYVMVNPDTGDFIVAGQQWVSGRDGQRVEYTIIDPGTGVPIAPPARVIWRVASEWVDTWQEDAIVSEVIARDGAEYPDYSGRTNGPTAKSIDITKQITAITPDALVEIAAKETKEGVTPRLALRGMIDDARAEGSSPTTTTPIYRDYELDNGKTIRRHDQLAPLNEVTRAISSTTRHVMEILPETPADVYAQRAVDTALNAARGGFRTGELEDTPYYTVNDGSITNKDLEHARNAVRGVYSDGRVADLPDQAVVEDYLNKLIKQAEANGGQLGTKRDDAID